MGRSSGHLSVLRSKRKRKAPAGAFCGIRMNYLLELMKDIYKKRRLIFDLAKADFRKRFVGSYFGVIWMFIQPIVTVAVYYVVFGIGFRSAAPIPEAPYVLWLVPGIVPWFFFSESLSAGTNCLSEYSYLVKKVVFRVEVLPIIKLLSCLIVHLIFVLIMYGLFLCFGWTPRVLWLQVLYYSFATFCFSMALVYFTSAVQVFFKDMAQIVGILLQFDMWLTPIMWQEQQFAGSSMYPIFSKLIKLNPMYYIAAGYRDSLIFGNGFWQRPVMTLYFWGVTILLFLVGLKVFKRLRPHFSDVL